MNQEMYTFVIKIHICARTHFDKKAYGKSENNGLLVCTCMYSVHILNEMM